MWFLLPYYKEADAPHGLDSLTLRPIAVRLPGMWHIQHEDIHPEEAHVTKAQSKNYAGESNINDFENPMQTMCDQISLDKKAETPYGKNYLNEISVILQLAA